ncbi:MAG: T9SS type A sorting domain-containing protein [Bacteroidota bacterium]
MKKLFTIALLMSFNILLFGQWSDDPLINTIVNDLSGSQAVPHIAYDASGNFYVGFYSNDAGNYDIRLQYYSFDGIAQWATNGIIVSNHPQNSWVTDWDLKTDNNGNCVLAFNDVRDGNENIYAYAISPTGSFLWGADGIALTSDPEFEVVPSITVNASNNAIVAWSRPSTTTEAEIVMQKITPSGTLSWGSSGITYQAGSQDYTGARVLGVDGDNYLMAFYKETGNFPALTRHIYVQKFDGSGNAVWANDVLVSNSNGINPYTNFYIASDNANGIIISWTDDWDSDMNIDGAVQHILSDGTTNWPANGVEVNTTASTSNQNVMILGADNSSNVLVTWSKKNSSQSQTAIAGQKINSSGVRQWTDDGIEFVAMSSDVGGTNGGAVFDGTSALIVYDVSVGGSSSHVKALGVNGDGTLIWSPTTTLMASRSTSKVHLVASPIYNNQVIAVWEENSTDIYMQNIYTDGSMGNPPISTDATLSDLTVNGTTVDGFSPTIYNYSMPIPTGDPLPITGATPSFAAATVNITQATAVPGQSIVLVTAEDGATQLTYTIDFYVAGTDATLSDLTVDGVTISGFAPDVFNYDYNVATGDPIPVVGATSTDPMALLTINQAISLPGAATVDVTSEDGLTTNTYTVNFLYNPGTDATLIDLLIAGVTIDGFDPVIYNYTYAVIYNNPAPYVQGIPTDPLATVDDTQCLSIPGDAILVVTAENGVTVLTYTVSFYFLGFDATLSDLTVDGVTIDGFDPNITSYQYLVVDITPIPVVDGTTTDPLATLTTTQATAIPSDATLHIVAEDGVNELTYTVHFYTLATDATLSDLTVDGTTIDNFSPATYYYEVDVFEGSPVPIIDGTTTDPLATMEITQASTLPDDGTIVVTAQDGVTELTYIVHFNLITGIYDTDETKVSTYPNPVINKLYVSGIKNTAFIEIINMVGKKVVSEEIASNLSIDVSFLNSGVYFAIIHHQNGVVNSVKFIKK